MMRSSGAVSDDTTLAGRLRHTLRTRANAIALLWQGRQFTYAELDGRSAGLARELGKRGIGPGDRVVVGLPNSPGLICAVLATLRRGAVLVPLNPAATEDEASHVVSDSAAGLVIAAPHSGGAAVAARHRSGLLTDLDATASDRGGDDDAWSAVDPEATALLVYTSGTTGKPKGVMLSQAAVGGNLATVAAAWQWSEHDRLLLTLPCFHLHGLALGILGSLLVGSSIALRERFAVEEIPTLLGDLSCTMFFGVPTMYNRLVLLSDRDIRRVTGNNMRLWVCGSAPLTVSTFNTFRERYGAEILERFGMSEGGFMIAAPFDGPRRPGVVGRALPGIDIRLVDPEAADRGRLDDVPPGEAGEIVIRGPNLFSGYWQKPAETARSFTGGFFRSGDLAVREADGMLRIVGRISVDIIKCRGFKVSAVEIENCLQTHPDVAEVAVVGVPHPDHGEQITAAIIAKTGHTPGRADLVAHVRRHLAGYKVPGRFEIVAEIPRSGPGKFNKRALIAALRE
jgi:malonyl-CoA/methylmalonyl-CoA synthetase